MISGVNESIMNQKITILLSTLFLLTAVFAAVPAAAQDNGTIGEIAGAVSDGTEDKAQALVFVSSEYFTLIVVLLILLIILLLLAIVYMISTLIPRLTTMKNPGIHLQISKTAKQQIERLMKHEGESNRTKFIQNLIVEELTRAHSAYAEQESIREAVSAYVDSPEAQDRFRRFVAESLLNEDRSEQEPEQRE